MYAIIVTGGKQIKAEVGQTIYIEKIEGQVGDAVTFDKVLYVEGETTLVGQPLVEGAAVKGTIKKTGKEPKIRVLRYKSKNNIRVARGHRQPYTAVEISAIETK